LSTDAYIRLGGRPLQSFGQTEHHDGLVFVDAPAGAELSELRMASYGLFRTANKLLVRVDAPIDSPHEPEKEPSKPYGEVADQLKRLQLERQLQWGLLHQPVGSPVWIEGEFPAQEAPEALARARAVELEALLDWGKGVWKPTSYHYLLPSGEHAAGFVRMADAIQSPRDAEVIASWIHGELAHGVGVVVDTGTLTPILLALASAMRSRLWKMGQVSVLDGYPATAFDVRLATFAASSQGSVIGLLSVNSSGTVRDHMLQALQDVTGEGRTTTLDVLVNKRPIASHQDEMDNVLMRTWHPRPGQEPLISYGGTTADACDLCRDSKTATLIPVSPRSFDGSLPATLAKITPQVSDAERNSQLWELSNMSDGDSGAITLDSAPNESMIAWRAPGNMAIVIRHERLLTNPSFCTAAAHSLLKQLDDQGKRPPHSPDLVLIPEHEYTLKGRSELIAAMSEILGAQPDVASFPANGIWRADLQEKVKRAENSIAILTLGAVTGTTLQSALAAVQASRDSRPYDLYAYVLHARLSEQRAWQALENSYSGLIFAAWHSYLPDRSALDEERKTLEAISDSQAKSLSAGAKRFLDERQRFLAAVDVAKSGVFWGSTVDSHLTPNSLFGQDLHGPAVYVAVCSAMERARKEQRSQAAPVRRVFEMPAIVRSYYDPMILAAILRWLRPHEAWWGYENTESTTIAAVLNRATPDHLTILIPELLLASAQGKLKGAGTTVVRRKAQAVLRSKGCDSRGQIELGLAITSS
jgi:hypothetical protein